MSTIDRWKRRRANAARGADYTISARGKETFAAQKIVAH
jgi:hypothetical protein